MNMDKNQKATLGCGTLILIVLIVIIFGNMGSKDAADQVRGLRNDVKKLEQTVTAQTRQIKSLEQRMANLLGPTTRAAQMTQEAKSAESR
jgi:cell division protein FtsL